jgi:hypothetical protein
VTAISRFRRGPGPEEHLGDLLSAFVDGALVDGPASGRQHAARERAASHLLHCASCREQAEAERALKARLARMRDPAVPASVTSRLLALDPGSPAGTLTPWATPHGPLARSGEPVRPGVPRGASTGPGRPAPSSARRTRRTLRRGALWGGAMSLVVVGGLVGASSAIAGPVLSPPNGPVVVPAMADFTRLHAKNGAELPLADPGLVAAAVSITNPGALHVPGVLAGSLPR